jgi:hypothetical protein
MVTTAKTPLRGDARGVELSHGLVGGVEPGMAVEVRTRFDGHWSRGFEVVAATEDGYRVRRLSDGIELPTQIAHQDVRLPRERKRGTWWY